MANISGDADCNVLNACPVRVIFAVRSSVMLCESYWLLVDLKTGLYGCVIMHVIGC